MIMLTKKDREILKANGWTTEQINSLRDENLVAIRNTFFYQWTDLGMAVRRLWSAIKESFSYTFQTHDSQRYTAEEHKAMVDSSLEGGQMLTYQDDDPFSHWTCHVCGEDRPDEKISVLTGQVKGLPGAEMNVRYCNDKPECLKGAKKKVANGKF